jgi:hypothetical protein
MKFFDDVFLKNILRQFILGASFAIGFLTIGIFAVTISGTINTFATGQVIKASDINTNFASIKTALENIPDWVKSGANASYPSGGITVNTSTQLNSATVTVNGRISSSVLGVYCGISTATTGNVGGGGGYPAAKALCVTACGNANAHMCTAHEMSISRQLGITIAPNTWYSTFTMNSIQANMNPTNDCGAWLDSSNSFNGALYQGTSPATDQCGNSRSIACCL